MDLLQYSQMKHLLLMQDSKTGEVYNLSNLFTQIEYATELMTGQPGKCTIQFLEDPRKIVTEIPHGSTIQYSINGEGVFKGYVFDIAVNDSKIYQVTAYDSLRYLKSEDNILTKNMTASDIFLDIVDPKYTFLPGRKPIQTKVNTPSSFIVPAYFHPSKTLYSVIYDSIIKTDVAETESDIENPKRYVIYDRFGTLIFDELQNMQTEHILGDKEYVAGFEYSSSIDESANTIKVFRDNEEEGVRDVWIELASGEQELWGFLQKLIEADNKEWQDADIIRLAQDNLKYWSRPFETCKLSCLSKLGLYAGNGFTLDLSKIKINKKLWILRAVHTFTRDLPVMDLEVFI